MRCSMSSCSLARRGRLLVRQVCRCTLYLRHDRHLCHKSIEALSPTSVILHAFVYITSAQLLYPSAWLSLQHTQQSGAQGSACDANVYLCLEEGSLPYQRVSTIQSEDSQHHKQVVLAEISLLKVWTGTVWMPSNSHLIHCKHHNIC